ncbi:MAG: hypothetical protein Greene041619_667 [Candidatus Peregrinibacteria bacterium Greene0416_19]|nr:MAG: hypothetical protein Greene041619_667 [Candidatus Peregrinibacteria bacterium Greene0416_19]
MSPSLRIIYASTSGHTEFVVQTLVSALHDLAPDVPVDVRRAEEAAPDDLLRADALILASGTWNTGGQEGQLNPHMHALLLERAAGIDLAGKPMAFISLGDDRYYFTTRCTEHFLRFMREHGGTQLLPPLIILNEPYEQAGKIEAWAERLHRCILRSG